MIVRMWHGRVPSEKAKDYRTFLNQRVIPDYRAVPGNLAVYILERPEREVTHFIKLSHWKDLDSIRAFAGANVQQARYYPEDSAFLLEFEPEVVHYVVVGEAAGKKK